MVPQPPSPTSRWRMPRPHLRIGSSGSSRSTWSTGPSGTLGNKSTFEVQKEWLDRGFWMGFNGWKKVSVALGYGFPAKSALPHLNLSLQEANRQKFKDFTNQIDDLSHEIGCLKTNKFGIVSRSNQKQNLQKHDEKPTRMWIYFPHGTSKSKLRPSLNSVTAQSVTAQQNGNKRKKQTEWLPLPIVDPLQFYLAGRLTYPHLL